MQREYPPVDSEHCGRGGRDFPDHHGALAYFPERIRKTDGRRCLALARRRGIYGRDEDELTVLARRIEQGGVYLRLAPAVALHKALVNAGSRGDFHYRQRFCRLGYLYVGHV